MKFIINNSKLGLGRQCLWNELGQIYLAIGKPNVSSKLLCSCSCVSSCQKLLLKINDSYVINRTVCNWYTLVFIKLENWRCPVSTSFMNGPYCRKVCNTSTKGVNIFWSSIQGSIEFAKQRFLFSDCLKSARPLEHTYTKDQSMFEFWNSL